MCAGSDLTVLTVSWLVGVVGTGGVQLVVSVVVAGTLVAGTNCVVVAGTDCGEGGVVFISVVSRSAGHNWPVPVVSSLVMS